MARTSTPGRLLPVGELGCGSEATVRRRLVEWSNAGVFEQQIVEGCLVLPEVPPIGGLAIGVDMKDVDDLLLDSLS
jgi:hypothetical protein